MENSSIFNKYYSSEKFVDRFELRIDEPVDVIIPLLNTNELWEQNLFSFYREIPISRLIIGDGGCTDDSIQIVRKFPRVFIIDQKEYRSQGYCIKELIEHVKTKWFVYLHADVYLPNNWYSEMEKHQKDYDWFECYRKMTTLVEFWSEDQHKAERAYSGSQMGRTNVFKNILPRIKDDYLQRNEDIIFSELIKTEGFRYGRISDTFHYHQVMNRRGEKEPKFKRVTIERERNEEWEKRISNMQARGIIKYLQPKSYLIEIVNSSLFRLWEIGSLDWPEFKKWVQKTNPVWLRYIRKKGSWKQRMIRYLKRLYDRWSE